MNYLYNTPPPHLIIIIIMFSTETLAAPVCDMMPNNSTFSSVNDHVTTKKND